MRLPILVMASIALAGCAAVNDFTVLNAPQSQRSNVVSRPTDTEVEGSSLSPKAQPVNSGQAVAGAMGLVSVLNRPGSVGAMSALAVVAIFASVACASSHDCLRSRSSSPYGSP